MHLSRIGRRERRAFAGFAAALMLSSLLVVAGPEASAAPPPNPSNGQIQTAQQQKDSLAAQVGALAAQSALMQSRLQQLSAQKELAEQKVAFALYKLAQAKTVAQTARQNVTLAQQQVDQAQHDFVGYVQAAYMSGDVSGTTGTLLTAADPSVLLDQSALQSYQSTHELSAIGEMQRATVAKSNADAAARLAVQSLSSAAAAAQDAEQQAVAAVNAAKQQQQLLQASLAANQTKLQSAQIQLATLNNQRAAFIAYQAEQARLAAARAAAAAAAAAAAQAAAAAAARAQANSGGGGGGGVASGPYVPVGGGGSWTAAKGQTAVARAERYLGSMYAWAGGNASGPTYGVCGPDGAFNDCNIVGFDCSGLVMYAWAQFPFVHYAATQYLQGSYHPDTSNLMPGDLVFWSSDGTVAGIHHVAIYIGSGMVIQAPQSGSLVQETPLDQVSFGYFGATRPLT